jgi:hypothetical protein
MYVHAVRKTAMRVSCHPIPIQTHLSPESHSSLADIRSALGWKSDMGLAWIAEKSVVRVSRKAQFAPPNGQNLNVHCLQRQLYIQF